MKRTRVKICGLTRAQDVQSAVAAGADALGFVFYPPSPRAVQPGEAAVLAAAVPPFVTRVGLFVDPDADTVRDFITEYGITFPIVLNPDDATVINYQVMGLPQTIVINPQGAVVWRQFGAIQLETFDKALMWRHLYPNRDAYCATCRANEYTYSSTPWQKGNVNGRRIRNKNVEKNKK